MTFFRIWDSEFSLEGPNPKPLNPQTSKPPSPFRTRKEALNFPKPAPGLKVRGRLVETQQEPCFGCFKEDPTGTGGC